MKRFIVYCVAAALSLAAMAQKVSAPDFAYPAKVAEQAESSLKSALKSGNGQMVVKALIDGTIARSSVNPEDAAKSLAVINEARSQVTDSVTASMIDLLLANIYQEIYKDNRWKYDQRVLPLNAYPANVMEWSGDMFRSRICNLYDRALANQEALLGTSVQKWDTVLTFDKLSAIYYPTLFDFAANQALKSYQSILTVGDVVPLSALHKPAGSVRLSAPDAWRILELYDRLVDCHANQPAPQIYQQVQRLMFLSFHIFGTSYVNNDSQESLRRQLRGIYDSRFRDTEFSGEALIAICDKTGADITNANGRALLKDINRFLKAYPAFLRANVLKNYKAMLEQKRMDVSTPKAFAPGSEVKIEVNAENVTSGHVDIYKVKRPQAQRSMMELTPDCEKIGTFAVSLGDTIPCYGKVSLNYKFDKEGCYIVVPVIEGVAIKNNAYEPLWCTRLAISGSTFDTPTVWVMNGEDGRPLDNISVFGLKATGNRSIYAGGGQTVNLGTTDAEGKCVIPSTGDNGMPLWATDGTSYTPSIWLYSYNNRKDMQSVKRAMVYTSLPVYRPGDKMEWSAVVYSVGPESKQLVSDKELTVVLMDEFSTEIASVTAVTDDYGRLSGSFDLPASMMQSQCRIVVNDGTSYVGDGRFTVSDYKLPTFAVETSGAETRPDGSVILHGVAKAYSGFPMGDAKVSVSLRATSRYRWRPVESQPFFSAEMVTGTDGSFTVTIPAEALDNSPAPQGPYIARFTVTSASGESCEASQIFARGPVYSLFVETPNAIDISKPASLGVKVTDMDDKPVNTRVAYRVMRGDTLLLSGNFMASNPVVDLSKAGQGAASISFRVEEGGDSATVSTILYSPAAKVSPVKDCVIWTPAGSVALDGSRRGQVLIAAPKSTHLLYTLFSKGKILEQRWIDFPAGMRTVEVSLPEGVEEASASFDAMADYKTGSLTVKLTAPDSCRKLEIKAESMRDKVVPGSQETWTFTITDTEGTAEAAAVILDMYNSALDAILPSFWTFDPALSYYRSWSMQTSAVNNDIISGLYSRVKHFDTQSLSVPEFNTYGRSLAGRHLGNTIMYKNASRAVMTEFKSAASAADAGDELAVKEVAMVAGSAEPAEGGSYTSTDVPFTYRDKEVPLAFFRPMLTTDDNGRLSVTFTVPDANTTWSFNAIAFNKALLAAEMTNVAVLASKPVMVQPNLPRYLRQGDRAEISALVMNNSDEQHAVSTVVEIFDPADGRVLQTEKFTSQLAPQASEPVVVTIDAPRSLTMLGYRVKSSIDRFADGEQALIPLLEAAQPVVQTMPFYIPEGERVYSQKLPEMSADAAVTLEFCENPAWYVVTALPGLTTSGVNTSINAASVLFSAAVADGIIRQNPSVAKALRQWTESNRSDSVLVSMLERNADLKIALLQATPWMMDARSDTERMERLSLLFDRGEIDKTIASAVSALSKMQVDGGWSWCADAKSHDRWATERVLSILGSLNRLGYTPKNSTLASMVNKAVTWLDASVAEDYRKYPNSNYTNYTRIRDCFPDVRQSTAAQRVSSATVQQLLGRWKDLDVADKAVAAMILYNHNYATTASGILESLREYAETSPAKGMWWPSISYGSYNDAAATCVVLDAFAMCDPGCADIDRIRQWLVLQKGAQNWGDCISATRIVASFLASSGKWMTPARGVEVKVGDTTVDATPADHTLGYFRRDISSLHPSGSTLTIAGSAATPSWGAVFCRDVQPLTAIEPHSVDDLEIEKSSLIIAPDGTAREANGRMQVGDRVRVTLTIRAGRTIDYLAIIDNRPACFEPVEQLPGYVWSEGLSFYRVNADATTSLYIRRLPAGTYLLTYDMWVNSAGIYTAGAATAQSQYAPSLTANSSGGMIEVEQR